MALVGVLFSILGCEKALDQEEDFSIIGRWHLAGFEQTVLYEFTPTLRYTIYSTDGSFGGLETAIPNPNPWVMRNDSLAIDLHFGNTLVVYPSFYCEGNGVDLKGATGQVVQSLYRNLEGINQCD